MMENVYVRRISWQTLVEALGFSVPDDATLLFQAKSYTVSTVPSASTYARGVIYVSNEAGGAVIAFSDGTNWRRVTDRAIIS